MHHSKYINKVSKRKSKASLVTDNINPSTPHRTARSTHVTPPEQRVQVRYVTLSLPPGGSQSSAGWDSPSSTPSTPPSNRTDRSSGSISSSTLYSSIASTPEKANIIGKDEQGGHLDTSIDETSKALQVIAEETKPQETKPSSDSEPSRTTTGLFDGHSAKSEDFIIDLWAEGDPYELYPIDVLTYLMLVGRTRAIRDQYEEGDLRTRAEIKEGIETLKKAKEDGKGLFFEVGHQFSEAAFKKFPHFPYIYGLNRDKLWDLQEETVTDRHGDWDPYEIDRALLIQGNVRHPLPPDINRYPGHRHWENFIATAYIVNNPIATRGHIWGATGWGIEYYIHDMVAHRTGSPSPPYPIDMEDESLIEPGDEYGHTDDEEMTQLGTVTVASTR